MNNQPSNPWMLTASGHPFEYATATPEDIRICDISHHLSQINRFNGATIFPYSVAQHSVLMCQQARILKHSLLIQLDCLLHDAHEAYVGDMIRPMQEVLIGPGYEFIKFQIDSLIREKFFLPPQRAECKNLDNKMLVTEREQLLPLLGPRWLVEDRFYALDIKIIYWPWAAAKANFEASLRSLLQQLDFNDLAGSQ